MLSPDKRHSLTDLFAPPPGYFLHVGVGTSYSAQFEVLTATALALLGEEFEQSTTPDSPSVLHAIGRLRERFRLFVHQGGLSLQGEARAERLYALYDGFVRSVPLEGGGAFHPKLWVLKFSPRDTPELRDALPQYRLVCMSRNLTDSHCWEFGVALPGRNAAAVTPIGRSVAGFVARLVAADPASNLKLRAFPDELRRVTFEGTREMSESLRLLWQWPGNDAPAPLLDHLPARASRALVLSPFVRGALVSRLASYERLTLVSSQQELDALPESAHEALKNHAVYVLKTPDTAESPLTGGLHAKLYVIEEERGASQTLVGSANATNAAWGIPHVANVEAMLAFSPGISLAKASRELIGDPENHHPWVQRYERQEPPSDDLTRAQREVDRAERLLGTSVFRTSYKPSAKSLSLRVEQLAEATDGWGGCRVEVAPYLLLRSARADLWRELGRKGEQHRYENVEPKEVSAFVAVRIRHPELGKEGKLLTVQARADDFEPFREARDESILQELLAGKDVAALLWRLLTGREPPASHGAITRDGELRGHGEPTPLSSLLSLLSVEQVLESCSADPGRVGEVDSFLKVFGSVIDPEFVSFWDSFKSAHAQIQGASR